MKRIFEAICGRTRALAVIAFLGAQVAAAQNLNGPMGMAVDGSSNLYVANFYSSDVVVYNSALAKVATISKGMSYPDGVAVDRFGTLYVANSLSNSVTTYARGTHLQNSEVLTSGITNPVQVVLGDYGEVYVVNGSGAGVSVFDGLGEFLYSGGGGTVAVAVTAPFIQFWSAPTGGSQHAIAYIGDPMTMARYGAGFLAAAPFTTFTPLLAASNPNNGDMWVTDFPDVSVIHLDREDNVLSSFTPAGSPYGIAVDPVKGRLFVSEPEIGQIEVFNLKTLVRESVLK